MPTVFNNHLRQILLLALIILLGILMISQLNMFLPGLLGGVTLYIVSRRWFQHLTIVKKWRKGGTALLFILCFIVVIAIPVYISVLMVSPKIDSLLDNQQELIKSLQVFSDKIEKSIGIKLMSDENTKSLTTTISSFIPTFLNSTANILTNLIMMFFLLYYLLVSGKEVEKYLDHIIPLKPENVEKLAQETQMMISANAIGIPVICLVQGIVAAIGYLIFGIDDWAMWGFVTGIFAFFPLVGTMIVWVPLVIYLYSSGQSWTATALTIYSIVVTGNVDYITRLGLMKKIGNVHPLITVLGVLVGLKLFGFMGLIFGPLLISYFIILVRIYLNEFTSTRTYKPDQQT
ncbi:MAG: AI-2E family transporter [Bacteroidota bacterium]|nr:AI-2E family transporter [Ferruginibacter sp.]